MRTRLLVAVLFGTWAAYAWMFVVADLGVRRRMALLSGVLIVGTGVAMWTRRSQLTPNRVTAALALGSIVNVAGGGLVVAMERLWVLGFMPALASNWVQFGLGAVGVAGATFTWSRARGAFQPAPKNRPLNAPIEPAPPRTPVLNAEPNWEGFHTVLRSRSDAVRARHLTALQRVAASLSQPEEAHRVVHQEALRLVAESEATERESEDQDVLSQAASLLEWGAQKLPELAELDVSDLMMGKAIADIRAKHSHVEHIFVDHRSLLAIHPIDRATAEAKCDERADAARCALPTLEANGMRLSEEMVAADPGLALFQSVTGFQVVDVGEGYVTFEGNGRREALQRAFGEERGVQVEVRVYRFDDPDTAETIIRRVQRVRRWKGVL